MSRVVALAILLLSIAIAAPGVKYSPVMTEGIACNEGDTMTWLSGSWACAAPPGGGGGGIPAGAILMVDSGSCPAGFTEHAGLGASRFPMGTVAANADAGGTGGSNTFTPAGTNSAPTFSGSALSGHAHGPGTLATSAHSGAAVADHASHTHSYSQVVNHTHAVNVSDPGHTHVQGEASSATGGLVGSAPDTSTNTRVNTGYSTSSATTGITATTANPAGGVAQGATDGPGATLTHNITQPADHTLSGSTQSVSGGTPAGNVTAPNFTGTEADQRPAWLKVIYCEKT